MHRQRVDVSRKIFPYITVRNLSAVRYNLQTTLKGGETMGKYTPGTGADADEAAAMFAALPEDQQDTIIALIKSLLSEQSQDSAAQASDK